MVSPQYLLSDLRAKYSPDIEVRREWHRFDCSSIYYTRMYDELASHRVRSADA
jgi:hypothetical protein